jgi:hypothetical protein
VEAVWDHAARKRDAALRKRNEKLRAIAAGDYSSIADAEQAAASAYEVQGQWLTDAWKAPAASPVPVGDHSGRLESSIKLSVADARAQAEEAWHRQGADLASAWKGGS